MKPLTIDDIAKASKINTAFQLNLQSKATLELLEANMIAAWMEPVPWYRRAWFKVADLLGRVPDAWAVLRGRARIETEDW